MIGVTRDGHVVTLEMQRPERRNALNSELVDSLREAVEQVDTDDVRAIVLTGQGTVFCAGADLSGDVFAADFPDKAIALNMAIDKVPIPVIAAINGPAIGAGVQLAMISDLRVVAPEAFFQFPIAKYGLALDNWSIRRLSSLVGHGRARGMLLAAERLSADTALQTGMANRIGTLADAQAWAAEIAGFAPLSVRHSKRVLNDDGAYEEQWPAHKEGFEKAWASSGRRTSRALRCCARRPGWPEERRRCSPAAGRCARCTVPRRRWAPPPRPSTRWPRARPTIATARLPTSSRHRRPARSATNGYRSCGT
jgi:enoyl-CoA hydratase